VAVWRKRRDGGIYLYTVYIFFFISSHFA